MDYHTEQLDLCVVGDFEPDRFHSRIADRRRIACGRIDFPGTRRGDAFNEGTADTAVGARDQNDRT
jgi:hypothetical protein